MYTVFWRYTGKKAKIIISNPISFVEFLVLVSFRSWLWDRYELRLGGLSGQWDWPATVKSRMVLQVVRLQTDKFISAFAFCSCKAGLKNHLRPSVHYGPCCYRHSLWFWGCSLLLSIGMCVLHFMLSPQNQPLNTLIIKSVKQAISEQSDWACNQAHFIIILIVKGLHDYRLQDRNKVPLINDLNDIGQ